MVRPARSVAGVSITILVLVALSLGGCGIVQEIVPPGEFRYVDQVREELELESVGEIQADSEFGGKGFFTDSDPHYAAIILGEDAAETLESRLVDQGYTEGETFWEKRLDEGKVVGVYVDSVQPGEEVHIGADETAQAEEIGVSIDIRG